MKSASLYPMSNPSYPILNPQGLADLVNIEFSGNDIHSITIVDCEEQNTDISGMVFLTTSESLDDYVIIVKSKRIFSFNNHGIAEILIKSYDSIKNCDTVEDMLTIAKMLD